MRHRTYVALAVLAMFAAACGTTVSDQQAKAELAADGQAVAPASASAAGSRTTGALAAGPGDATTAETAPTAGGAGPAGAGPTPGAAGATPTTAAAQAAQASRGGATDVGVTADEIRLGWVGTLTGPVPGIFRGALAGTQAWVNYQNSQGGLMGRRLKLIPGDDALDSGKNRAAHLQLKDKVFAFVGSFSINDDGGASVVTECKCPDITGNLSAAMHASPSHFGPQPAAPGWRSGPPRWYAQKFGKDVIEHLAIFYSQVPVSEAIAAQQRRVYEEAGFKVVYTRGIPPNDNNQTADVVQMKRAGVRAIAFQGDLTSMSKLANAMQQQGFKVDLFNMGNAIYDQNTFKVLPPANLANLYVDQVYAMFLGEDGARIAEVRLFNEWMKKTNPGQPVDLFAMYGWLSGRLFGDAMAKMAAAGKNPVRADLLNTLRAWGTWDGYGMVAPVQIGTKTPSNCFFVFTSTTDGKFQRVFPNGQNYACDVGPFSPKP
jgi:ABC-type branched-subunit amino acid transport system substrate-binding protein